MLALFHDKGKAMVHPLRVVISPKRCDKCVYFRAKCGGDQWSDGYEDVNDCLVECPVRWRRSVWSTAEWKERIKTNHYTKGDNKRDIHRLDAWYKIHCQTVDCL